MRIKSLVSAAHPDHTFQPGVEIDVPEALGRAMIKAGQAVAVAKKGAKTAQEEPDDAPTPTSEGDQSTVPDPAPATNGTGPVPTKVEIDVTKQ